MVDGVVLELEQCTLSLFRLVDVTPQIIFLSRGKIGARRCRGGRTRVGLFCGSRIGRVGDVCFGGLRRERRRIGQKHVAGLVRCGGGFVSCTSAPLTMRGIADAGDAQNDEEGRICEEGDQGRWRRE